MNINELKYFIASVEEKSVAKAAGKLFISYQGLSKALKNLENEVGYSLFERSGHKRQLTEYGKEFFLSAKRIVQEWNRMQIAMQQIQRKENNLYHIGIAMGVDRPFLDFRKKLDEFLSMHSNLVSIDAWDSYCEEKILTEELDLAITFGPIELDNVHSSILIHGSLAALIHMSHPLYKKDRLEISDLKQQGIITVNRHFRNYDILVGACKKYGFDPKVILNTVNLTKTLMDYKDKKVIGISNTLSYPMKQIEDYRIIPIKSTNCQINLIRKNTQRSSDTIQEIEKSLIAYLMQ